MLPLAHLSPQPKRILIASAVSAGLTIATDRQNDKQTSHSVTTGRHRWTMTIVLQCGPKMMVVALGAMTTRQSSVINLHTRDAIASASRGQDFNLNLVAVGLGLGHNGW